VAHVFELAKVIREGGNTEADERRIGRKYTEHRVETGYPASMYHADDSGKLLLTSPVTNIHKSATQIVFGTKNTVYFFRRLPE
jgi:hypothetical protein